jgi:hypothetical protein
MHCSLAYSHSSLQGSSTPSASPSKPRPHWTRTQGLEHWSKRSRSRCRAELYLRSAPMRSCPPGINSILRFRYIAVSKFLLSMEFRTLYTKKYVIGGYRSTFDFKCRESAIVVEIGVTEFRRGCCLGHGLLVPPLSICNGAEVGI